VNPRSWIALAVAVLVTATLVRWIQRRARRAPTGRRFFRHRGAALGLGVLVFFSVIAVAAPFVAPYRPTDQLDIVGLQNRPPSWRHLLGTDVYSHDVWSRIVYGTRVSLSIGALAALVAVSVGAALGAVGGYFRRGVDAALMRFVDVGLALPRIFLMLAVIALFGQLSVAGLILLIGGTGWFATSRLVRADVLTLRERAFVDAAHALGAGPGRVIARHLLPNVAATVIISTALGIGHVMLLEAGLSFLGMGVRPPTSSWGNMMADSWRQLEAAPWSALAPGAAVALVVMALNAVGDALRDALDPRQEIP